MDNWTMLWFTDRYKLNEIYKEWIKENPSVKDCSFNVITFFSRIIDVRKARKFIKERDKEL